MRPRTNAWNEFHELGLDGVHMHKRVKCKHCEHEFIAQALKMEHHLRICKMYDGEEYGQPITPTPRRRQQPEVNGSAAAAASNNSGCSVCGQFMPVKKCGRCRETQCCSVDCQKRDWRSRKEFYRMPALVDG